MLEFELPEYGSLTFAQVWNRALASQGHFPTLILDNNDLSIAMYFEEMSEKYGEGFLDF